MTSHLSDDKSAKDSSIKEALEKALKNPVKHGTFSLVLYYRDAHISRFVTTLEESHMIGLINTN
jgi:hypothetical protein